MNKPAARSEPVDVERVQTGVRLEKRLLKVLKGLAESLDLSLGDLLEGIALHALENKPPFSATTLKTLASHVKGYGQTRSALHFDALLPAILVRKLLRTRIAESKRRERQRA